MKLVTKSRSDARLVLSVSGVDTPFLNTVRRMVMEEVPTLAVEDVEFHQNNSALYDEIIAHRLGLIPIKTDLSSYSLPTSEADIVERSALCTVRMELKTSSDGIIYAKDATSDDPSSMFVYPDMPVVKLINDQKVHVTMHAVMGQGKEHMKWSPGLVWYAQQADITVKQDKKLLEQVRHKLPTQIFSGDKILADKIVELDLLDVVEGVCPELISVKYTGSYTFSIESWGQLSCEDMLSTAAGMLAEKAKLLKEVLQ